MAAQLGKDLLLKVGPSGSTETVGGFRTKTMTLNAETVDVTHSESAGRWRELLAGAGVKNMSFSGEGVFIDDATAETMRAEIFAQAILNYELIVPDFGTFEGAFQVTSLEYGGEQDGEVTYSVTLESAGEITWTAA